MSEPVPRCMRTDGHTCPYDSSAHPRKSNPVAVANELVTSQADSEKIRAVAREAYDLWRRGYDGPFMGEDIEPLFKALAELDKAKIKL